MNLRSLQRVYNNSTLPKFFARNHCPLGSIVFQVGFFLSMSKDADIDSVVLNDFSWSRNFNCLPVQKSGGISNPSIKPKQHF